VVGMVRAWTGRPAGFEFVFIGFWFSGGERLICRVTGPRRFPLPNHATGFEIFFGREERDFLNPQVHTRSQRDCVAQPTGCEERATLVTRPKLAHTPKGLNPPVRGAGWRGADATLKGR
jgi:hypothetical protein